MSTPSCHEARNPALIPPPSALLSRTLAAHRPELEAAFGRVLAAGQFLLGPECEAFESEFAAELGGGHAVGASSGTAALALALASCGVGPGSKVLMPSLTASAGGAAVRLVGARPVYADVEPDRPTLDPDALAARLASAEELPAAIVAVHLHGTPADMPRLAALAEAHGVPLVEDCAQAFGAEVGGRHCGQWGDAAAFSFHPTKNLAAVGDAGAVLTSSERIAERARAMREYGWQIRQRSDGWGINGRLDELQAAFLRVLLPHAKTANARRVSIARALGEAISETAVEVAPPRPGARPVPYCYALRSVRRDALATALGREGVDVGFHPPYGLHEQRAYASEAPADLPSTERFLRQTVTIALSPALTDAEVEGLCGAVECAAGTL